jgi:hypothetical protein
VTARRAATSHAKWKAWIARQQERSRADSRLTRRVDLLTLRNPSIEANKKKGGRLEIKALCLRAREWLSRSLSRPMHPGGLRCSSVTYQQYAPSSRLASRAPRPRSSTDLAIPGPLATVSHACGVCEIVPTRAASEHTTGWSADNITRCSNILCATDTEPPPSRAASRRFLVALSTARHPLLLFAVREARRRVRSSFSVLRSPSSVLRSRVREATAALGAPRWPKASAWEAGRAERGARARPPHFAAARAGQPKSQENLALNQPRKRR